MSLGLYRFTNFLSAKAYTGLFRSSQIHRSQIRTFRSSTRKLPLTALIAKVLTTLGLDTDDFADFATKIDKLEGDVSGLKGDVGALKGDVGALKGDVGALKEDVSALKADIKELGPRLEHTVKEQLGGYALNQEKQFSQFYFRSFFGVSLTPYIMYQFLTKLRSWVLQSCWSVVHGLYR